MKVLIVDDDANIAMALQIIISTTFSCKAVDTAADGMEAWEKIQAGSYDLVISDWNMPRMDGNQLLQRMKSHEQTRDIQFLMLTMRKDVESVAAAIKAGIADYIIKPFDKDLLIGKIGRLLSRNGQIKVTQADHEKASQKPSTDALDPKAISIKVMELIGSGDVNLPSMPQIIFEIQDEMKKEGAGVKELAKLIEMDPAISSKLIGVANSVYYRGLNEFTIVEDAIARLGLEATKKLVYLVSNRNLYASTAHQYENTTKELYLHALACAAASQSLAEQLRLPDSQNFFSLGLMHDIGKLLVLQVLAELTREMRGIDLTLSIDIMNALHNKAGYMLLTKWSFPPVFSAVALNHDDLPVDAETDKAFLVVHIANLLVMELGYSLRTEPVGDLLNTRSAQLLKLNNLMLEKAREDVKDLVAKSSAVL